MMLLLSTSILSSYSVIVVMLGYDWGLRMVVNITCYYLPKPLLVYGLMLLSSTSILSSYRPVAPVAQRYHVTSDTLGREFDPGKRDFSH